MIPDYRVALEFEHLVHENSLLVPAIDHQRVDAA
jgi:hypothetical protein